MKIKFGNTPTVKIEDRNGIEIFAKLEYENPTGSVKDRAAYYMLERALLRGDITKGATIVEPTSGNTGIGLAYMARELGLNAVMVMPASMSKERVSLIEGYGARVVLSPPAEGMKGSVTLAQKIVSETPNSFMPMQFSNPDNPLAHFETTAPEIFRELPGLDWLVAGVGTGGTVMGVKRYIEENGLKTKVCAVQPQKSPVLTGGKPASHGIQGIGANFIPDIVDTVKIDKIIDMPDEKAVDGAVAMKNVHGIFCGISAGAAYMAALRLADEIEEMKKSGFTTNDVTKILFIVPDNGQRYLSLGIFD